MGVCVEASEHACGEFPQPGQGVKTSCQACKDCSIKGDLMVQLPSDVCNEFGCVWTMFLPLQIVRS